MKINKKIIIKYIFMFIFFFFCVSIFYFVFTTDFFLNFGFSYAISKGEIAYNDFNIIIPLFSPFLYSIGMIFSNSIIVFYLEQAFLLCILSYFLFKLIGNKTYLFFIVMLFVGPIQIVRFISPGYNFLSFLLLIIIIYLEEKNSDRKYIDYIIGFLFGLLIINKQNIGIVLFIPNLYYLFKDYKKFLKRLLGVLVVCFIFLLYLFFTNSLFNFINLCILGLSDFNENFYFNNICLIVSIICIIYVVYIIIKRKYNKIIYFYILFYSVIIYPLVDDFHCSYYIMVCLFLFLYESKFELNKIYIKYICIYLVCVSIILSYLLNYKSVGLDIKSYNNIEFMLEGKNYHKCRYELLDYLKKYDIDKIYLLNSSENYILKIINDDNINYYDLNYYGNYGYKGVGNMLNKIKSLDDTIFVLYSDEFKVYGQHIVEFDQYIKKHSKKINNICIYDIYYYAGE